MHIKVPHWVFHPYFLPALILLVVIIVWLQSLLLTSNFPPYEGVPYTHYNNYKIFKTSFFNLFANNNLYLHYPKEQFDLYKYSPTFALLMAPMALLPDAIGLMLWLVINTFPLYFAIRYLPRNNPRVTTAIVLFVLFELITCLQNSQSNSLLAGLLIGALVLFERRQNSLAILLIVGSAFVKIFGVVALILLLFYPGQIKSIGYVILWTVVLALLPAVFIPFDHLIQQYENWWILLKNDHSDSLGLSVMGWMQAWFGTVGQTYKSSIPLMGAALLCFPLIYFRNYSNYTYRLNYLCAILIWIVIFNHKAESPTFIIAAVGVAIWYFYKQRKPIDTLALILTFLLTVLSPTDLFPRALRNAYVVPYVLKAFPCILVWVLIMFELIRGKQKTSVLNV